MVSFPNFSFLQWDQSMILPVSAPLWSHLRLCPLHDRGSQGQVLMPLKDSLHISEPWVHWTKVTCTKNTSSFLMSCWIELNHESFLAENNGNIPVCSDDFYVKQQQHSNRRHKAVVKKRAIGVSYPPPVPTSLFSDAWFSNQSMVFSNTRQWGK